MIAEPPDRVSLAPSRGDPSEFVAGRMALFAATWAISTITWSVVLAVGGTPLVPLAIARAAELTALGLMVLGALRARSEAAAVSIAAAGCVMLGWIELAAFVWTYAPREVLCATLLTLYSVPALAFAWGWRTEAAVVGATLVPAFAATAWLAPAEYRSVELHTALALGIVISLGVAEVSARSLARTRAYRRDAEERTRELAASRDAYRDLAEEVRDFIWAIDLEGRWTYLNAAFERFLGGADGSLIGQSGAALTLAHPAAHDAYEEIRRFAAGQTPGPLRFLFDVPSGLRWVETLPSGVYAPDGTLVGIRGISRDITERMVVDTQLRESEAKFRMVAEAMAIPVFLVRETQILYVNAASVRMLGYSEEEQLAAPFWHIIHPDDRPLVMARAEARQRGDAIPPAQEYRVVTKSGEVRWVEFDAVLIDYQGAPAILGNVRDVTERKLAEEALRTSLAELRASEERLRLLSQRQVAIREEERKRIGFDLHDGVCQELIGVGILIASIRERLQPEAREAAAAIGRAVGYLNDVVEHLRVLARELRPMILHDLGLEASLGSLAAGLSTPERPVAVELGTPIPRLAEDVELAVYRIAQEALTNAVRHADARSIVVSVTAHNGHLRLAVSDDGRGFDPRARNPQALGLAGMQERATALGGHFSVASAPGAGTTVAVEWSSSGD
jgi:PAS domain S-box-containing protein